MAEKTPDTAQRDDQRLARRDTTIGSPFTMLERLAGDMDRVLDEFGFSSGWLRPRWSRRSLLMPNTRGAAMNAWVPAIELHQRNHELVVRADLPGMKMEDVKVEVTDDAITIQGERRHEEETDREGFYRTERSYGSFCRTIPLPEGAMTDQAKATFKNGVLEVTMPAPPEQVTRGRRLEIKEGSESKK